MSKMNKTESINPNLLNDVISFIENAYGSFELISESSKLEEDLGITGDEACDFLIKYGKAFKVDISNFSVDGYFKPEGYSFLDTILEDMKLKKKYIKKDFTVGDLIKGIQAGKLDNDILNTSCDNEQ